MATADHKNFAANDHAVFMRDDFESQLLKRQKAFVQVISLWP